mgnify:CR=1 FL=1
MIKFFRQIRQNLIMENKTGKYLKYAIGEIVLVVIGILIALEVNNWNENRKDSIEEKAILENLSKSREILSLVNGYKDWHEYEEVLKRKDFIFDKIDKIML